MRIMAKGAVLAGAAVVVLAMAGCQKNAAPASNAMSPTAGSATAPTAVTPVSANLPQECQALLAALQACSDRLASTNAPGAALFRSAVEQTRQSIPAAASDPALPAQCAESLKKQAAAAPDLGC